jgi:hypothetical protein
VQFRHFEVPAIVLNDGYELDSQFSEFAMWQGFSRGLGIDPG